VRCWISVVFSSRFPNGFITFSWQLLTLSHMFGRMFYWCRLFKQPKGGDYNTFISGLSKAWIFWWWANQRRPSQIFLNWTLPNSVMCGTSQIKFCRFFEMESFSCHFLTSWVSAIIYFLPKIVKRSHSHKRILCHKCFSF